MSSHTLFSLIKTYPCCLFCWRAIPLRKCAAFRTYFRRKSSLTIHQLLWLQLLVSDLSWSCVDTLLSKHDGTKSKRKLSDHFSLHIFKKKHSLRTILESCFSIKILSTLSHCITKNWLLNIHHANSGSMYRYLVRIKSFLSSKKVNVFRFQT